MADLLVPLYNLKGFAIPSGFEIRRPMSSEGLSLQRWIAENFGEGWASEIIPGMSRTPADVLMAVEDESLNPAGFCVWNCTALGFLGPVGVVEAYRGKGLGRALVVSVLHEMAQQGFGYAIVGDAGPVQFFRNVSGAVEIPGSKPGIYRKRIQW